MGCSNFVISKKAFLPFPYDIIFGLVLTASTYTHIHVFNTGFVRADHFETIAEAEFRDFPRFLPFVFHVVSA